MCGVVGFFKPKGLTDYEKSKVLSSMCNQLVHRGPDDEGKWIDAESGIALAHRRLSIVDLTYAGHQPMDSTSGRYCLIFNGELYNHLEIRRKLGEGIVWRGTSDTETLVAAIEHWGIIKTLQACVGMFAIVVWDRIERTLSLARDRMGEKPLYFGWQDDTLLFASELKALKVHPAFKKEIDRDVLSLYLRLGYIPAPWSIWRGIRKLKPGCVISFSSDSANRYPEPVVYWSFEDVVVRGSQSPFEGSYEEAIHSLESILGNAVSGQMVADVPLGAFLSGGVDSSAIVALMQERASRPIKTYSIGFHEQDYDEALHAKKVASHLGTEHTEFYITPKEAYEVVPELHTIYDEPFGDSSAIPTHLVSKLARQEVTVALSGDGGDELFGGYGRYFNKKAEHLRKVLRVTPTVAISAIKHLFEAIPVPSSKFASNIEARLQLVEDLAKCNDFQSFYQRFTSQWAPPPVSFDSKSLTYGLDSRVLKNIQDHVGKMMAMDTCVYMPDCILTKLDRAAMSTSLETRVPLLDHRVVEFAWRIPITMKVNEGKGKWIFKQLLYRHVPKELIERPKQGFGVPVGSWIKGPLREWAESLLDAQRLREQGLLDSSRIRDRWAEHASGYRNWQHPLWVILMFQAWAEAQ
jgi:asparagine synthase (glutamine-hydrolysing)